MAMAVLVAVAEEGSFSAGARRLRTPLATVSRKIADLETHLRARLMVRTSRHVELTDAGQTYFASAKRILKQVKEAECSAAGEYIEPRGQLAVTSSVDLGHRLLAPLVTQFLLGHPEIQVSMLLTDRMVNLVEERVDLAIRVGDVDTASFVATRVGEIRLVTCASPAYLARADAPARPEDLRQLDCIVMADSMSSNWATWRFHQGSSHLLVEPRPRMMASIIGPAIDAAVSGLGIIQTLSYHVREQLADGRLVSVLDDFAPPPLPTRIVYPDRDMMPLKTRKFIDFIVPPPRAQLA
jgi:DNA-binding transcriptional LysR family regulator